MITLNKHEISTNIKDRYANIAYSFDFENTNNYGSHELKFEITIEPKAFISSFEANIDNQLFVGQTKEKQIASKQYNKAKRKKENAILISQPHKNIPNVFQIKTNIQSQSKVLLTVKIEQYIQKKFELNELNIQILQNFHEYHITPNFDYISFKFNIEDERGIYDVHIPITHNNDNENNNDIIIDEQIMDKMNKKCQISGKKYETQNINEITLKYKIKGEENDTHILFDNKSNTFCHIISDIITDSVIMDETINIDEGKSDEIVNNVFIPRRVILVIDRSASMTGLKWEKTIFSTITAIKQLEKGYDRFGILLFDSNIQLLPYQDLKGCILASNENITESIEKLQNEDVGGSTNINDALLKAIELIKIDILSLNSDNNEKYNFFMNQIILITDGAPNNGESNTQQIISNIQNANNLSKIDKYNDKISIFSFGVGNDGNDSGWIKDLNHSFLKSLAVNNKGFYHRIKQTFSDTVLCEFFNILSKPILSNINVEYKNKNIKHLTETKFNTLYSGNDLIICGKIGNVKEITDYNITLNVSAITGKKMEENNVLITKPINISKNMKININMNKDNDQSIHNIERIWAYLKLQQFAKQQLIHHDMIEMDDDEKKEEESLPLSLALKYQFVTPWTSMIVVKSKIIKQPPKQQKSEEKTVSLIKDAETKRVAKPKIITFLKKKGLSESKIIEAYSAYYKEEGLYEITFNHRPLGFSVIMDTRGNNAIVSSIQDGANQIFGMKVTSKVYEINGKRIDGLKHKNILKLISQQQTPFNLVFKESRNDRNKYRVQRGSDEEDGSSDSDSDTISSYDSDDDEAHVAHHYSRKSQSAQRKIVKKAKNTASSSLFKPHEINEWDDNRLEDEQTSMLKQLSRLMMGSVASADQLQNNQDIDTNDLNDIDGMTHKRKQTFKTILDVTAIADLTTVDEDEYHPEIFRYLSELIGDTKQSISLPKDVMDEDILKSLEKGTSLLKYKMFHLTPDHKHLVWFSEKTSLRETRIPIQEIRKIAVGSDSKVVEETKKADIDDISFTIYYGKTNNEKMWKALTVTAKNQKQAFVWAQGLKILCDATKQGKHLETISKNQILSAIDDSKTESVILSIDKLKKQSVVNLFSKSSQITTTSLLKEYTKLQQKLQKCVDFVMTKANYRAIANAGQFDKIKVKLEDLDNRLRDINSKLATNNSDLSSIKAQLFSCSADLDALKQKLTAIVRRPQKL